MGNPVRNIWRRPAVDDRPQVIYDPGPPPPPADWARIRNHQLGVRAIDPVGHQIGTNIAKRTGLGLNWYPLERFKQTVVGKVERYAFYNPGPSITNPRGSGDEADWNIFMRPSPAFAFIVDDALPNADMGKVHRSNAGDNAVLLEAEITPDESFYNNPYFHQNGTSSLLERDIGLYGPWVADEGHGFRPEIHPCEMLWWRDMNQGLSTHHLMIVQDDSNRFDRRDDYSGNIEHPWSESPRNGEFWITIDVAHNAWRQYRIEELYGRNVANLAPANTLSSTIFNPPGGGTIRVDNDIPDIRHLSVRFENFHRPDGSDQSFGYMVLKTRVGRNDRGREGYQVLKVTQLH